MKEKLFQKFKIFQSKIIVTDYVNYSDALDVWFKSSNKSNYLYTNCPICNYGNKYIDRKTETYCINCGQKLKWEHVKTKRYEIQKYEILYTIRGNNELYKEIRMGINMKETILDFYNQKPNRFEILTITVIK